MNRCYNCTKIFANYSLLKSHRIQCDKKYRKIFSIIDYQALLDDVEKRLIGCSDDDAMIYYYDLVSIIEEERQRIGGES